MASFLPWQHRYWTGEREQAWCQLEQWLKLNYSGDVMMPAPSGEKRPAYTHAAGSWTWARYDWICRKRTALAGKDIGILLRDICVIDVDTVADADALEARFPELCAAPAEATARGRHYFFSRSAKADAEGYYDGAAQKTPTVDFKTRAWGGGSGFVIVAPSTNKTWLRAPWEVCPSGELPIISDALLDAVAVPRHAPLRVALRFLASGAESPTVEHVSTLLPTCSYCITALAVGDEETALSAALSAVTLNDAGAPAALPELLIPEQFAADVFFDLERVAAGQDPDIGDVKHPPAWLADAAAYEARMAAILALADFLGVPEAKMVTIRAAGAGGSRNRGLWLNISRPWALDCMAAARDAQAGKLVAVDAALSATLKHEPLLPNAPQDHRWVLHDGPRSREGLAAGARVLAGDPAAAAEAALPAFVLEALRSEAGHLALAGGAALAAVTPRELATSHCVADYDLFAYGFTGDADAVSASADALVRRIASMPDVIRGPRGAMVSRHAITFRVFKEDDDDDDVEEEFTVQIILRVAKNPADILGGFDLAPSKVCLLYDTSDSDELTVLAAPDWPLAMRHGAYALDGRAWSRATSLRVFKYAAKGFDALVPALTDRSKLRYRLTKSPKSWWRGREKLAHLDGFELIYALEGNISNAIKRETRLPRYWLTYRGVQPRTSMRITPKDVEKAARQLYMEQRTDYASALKTLRTLHYAVVSASKRLLQSVGIVAVPDALRQPLGWRQPWSRAQFHPVVADIADALSLMDTPVA